MTYVFKSLGYITQIELPGLMGTLFNFLELPNYSKATKMFYVSTGNV